MRTIEINVSDANYEKVRDLLEHLTYVESVNDVGEYRAMAYTAEIHYEKEPNVIRRTLGSAESIESHGSAEPSDMHGDVLESPAEPSETVGSAENTGTPKRKVDEVTLMSEASLAENWDSEEDERYSELYRAKFGKRNEVQKR